MPEATPGQSPGLYPRQTDWDAAYLGFILHRYQCTKEEAALVLSQVQDYAMDAMEAPGPNVTAEGQFLVASGEPAAR